MAHTALIYDVATGTISEADILLNGEHFVFDGGADGAFDTRTVVLHEAGHLLGLDHSCGVAGGAYPSCFDVPDTPPGRRDLILEAVMAPRQETEHGSPRKHIYGTATINGGKHRVIVHNVNGNIHIKKR